MSRCDQHEFGDDELYEHYVTQVNYGLFYNLPFNLFFDFFNRVLF